MTNNQSSPRPWRSVLAPHLDEIRKMRRARHTWKEIADRLREVHGISIAPPTVYLFFKRAGRHKRLPLGFEDPLGAGEAVIPEPKGSPSNDALPDDQPQRARTLPAWFPAGKETSRLTEEDLSFDTDLLKLRSTRK
jgi:hypothetical protein